MPRHQLLIKPLYKKEINKKIVILARPELITREFVDILASSQLCHSVSMGVESGSERLRREVLNRNYSNSQLIEISQLLHDAKISFRTYNLLALPTETEEEIWETINLNVAMKIDFPRGGIFIPFPGTKLAQIAIDMGYMDEVSTEQFTPYLLLAPTMLDKKFDVDRIQMFFYLFQTAILFPKLRPLIRKLISIKPNWVFRTWCRLVFGYVHYRGDGRNLLDYLLYAWNNRRYTN